MKKYVALLALTLLPLACDSSPVAIQEETQSDAISALALDQTASAKFTATFAATALCSPEIGRIRFSGQIEGVDHTTVDGRGETHRTRTFRVHSLTAVNLDTGMTYDVVRGAEMLTWHTHLGQTPGAAAKSFHSGTLVFSPTDGGPKVVAHHAIRYLESPSGEQVLDFHSWDCRTRP